MMSSAVNPTCIHSTIEFVCTLTFQVGMANGQFINMYLEAYRTFDSNCWPCNSVINANYIALVFPHLIQVEDSTFNRPGMQEGHAMYGETYYNYTTNYCIHMYGENKYMIPSNEKELRGYNCTLGRVMRHVLYGSPQLLDTRNVTNGIRHAH